MATVLRADLETLLRVRHLDRTIVTPDSAAGCLDDRYVVATGIDVLDKRLQGGLPRGQMSELVGPRSSGRTSVLVAAMAQATSRGELVALVDALDCLDPASASAAGVDLRRLLWVRGRQICCPGHGLDAPEGDRPSGGGCGATVDRAVKAANLVLQAGGFSLVALDFGDVPAAAIDRLPLTTWRRLQRTIEGSPTAFVLIAPAMVARSAGGVSIALRAGDRWSGPNDSDAAPSCAQLLVGLDVEVDIQRARRVSGDDGPCRFRLEVLHRL